MKLAFNSMSSGLGNNGGSRTILKCCEVLNKLGHRCDVIANVDNFTWFNHKLTLKNVPSDLDVLISTAAIDVFSTLIVDIPRKAWYIRAHETWAMSESKLVSQYKDDRFLNIVNSNGLKQLLAIYGADSKVIYQGIDFDWWEDRNLRPKNKTRIGCLYTKQPRKRWEDFAALAKILGNKDYEYVGIGNADPKADFLTDFVFNVDHDKLCNLYSSCHVWFAPTDSEGLHNVPMEAALCGCLIICGDEPLNGMIYDYAFPNNTAMVYERKNIEHAADLIKHPNWDVIERMNNHLKNNIGTREKNMKKMISCLEKH